MNTTAGGPCFEPSSSSLFYSQASLSGLGGSHGSLQESLHARSNMLYSNCSGGLPNIILTGKHSLLLAWASGGFGLATRGSRGTVPASGPQEPVCVCLLFTYLVSGGTKSAEFPLGGSGLESGI